MSEKILARVGTLTVTEAEVDSFIAGLGQRGAMYNTPDGRAAVLQQLIASKLLLIDGRRNLYEGEAAYREQLARLKDNLLINYAAEKIMSSVSVSEAEVKEYYEGNRDKFVAQCQVNASHILVDTEESARQIYEKIASGEMTFEAAAEAYSTCPSKANGGNLGDFTQGQMVPEFDSAVFSMQVGEITKEPIKTQFGYHLIKLISKTEPAAMPFDEVREELRDMLLQNKQQKAYESKINQLKIMYPVDIL